LNRFLFFKNFYDFGWPSDWRLPQLLTLTSNSDVMLVHFVVVELLQETETLWTFWALVNGVSEMDLQVLHVVAFLLVRRRAVLALEGFLRKKTRNDRNAKKNMLAPLQEPSMDATTSIEDSWNPNKTHLIRVCSLVLVSCPFRSELLVAEPRRKIVSLSGAR
jgi:hypothetical protein